MKHSLMPFWLALLAMAVSVTGCQSLKETDPDTPLEVKVGEEFTIAIQSNPSTGYVWRLAEPLDETLGRIETKRAAFAMSFDLHGPRRGFDTLRHEKHVPPLLNQRRLT